jgi:hypothetical protein
MPNLRDIHKAFTDLDATIQALEEGATKTTLVAQYDTLVRLVSAQAFNELPQEIRWKRGGQ